MSIPINQIKYVLALHKTGSFSEAAKMSFVTQSTLSTMIKRLENALDIVIFDRKQKPIKLTAEGEKLIEQFIVVDNESENLIELVQETKGQFYGTLNIGIIPTLAPFLLPLFLDRITTQYQDVNFTVLEITTAEIIERLKLRDIDIGILSLPIKDDKLTALSLFEEEFIVYDTNQESNAELKYSIKDIDIDRLMLLEADHCMTNQIEKICNLKTLSTAQNNLIFKSSSILTLINLIHKNHALTILPKLATYQDNLIQKKYLHQFRAPVPVREVGILIHQNFKKRYILDALVKHIKDSIANKIGTSQQTQVIKPF